VLWRTFRMLQLLCENNNVDFKRYLLQQSDKDGQVNINSINFVEQATKELRQFLKLLNRDIISVPIQIIDFINEII
jgi:inositol 1,4,5-triphosphate receptor type 1/inositol 1,4,5-triphosphate receptor type 3